MRACSSALAGGNSSLGLHSGTVGVRSGVLGLCAGGVCRSLGGLGVSLGVGLFPAGVCGLPGVGGGEARTVGGSMAGWFRCSGGWGRPVSRGPGLRAIVGVCGSLAGECRGGGRGCGAGSPALCPCTCLLAAARSCGLV